MKPTSNSRKSAAVIPGTSSPKIRAKSIKILLPTDFSEPSVSALKVAVDFARIYGGRITLLHVLEPPALPRVSVYPYTVKIGILVSELASQLTSLARKHIEPEYLEKALVYHGKPFEEIVKAARVLNIDLIIIATHGYTGVRRMVLGSTAERVIRYAPCPVLTVQAGQKRSWPPKVVKSRR